MGVWVVYAMVLDLKHYYLSIIFQRLAVGILSQLPYWGKVVESLVRVAYANRV